MYKNTPNRVMNRPKANTSGSAAAPRLVLMHKPYQVICQFSPDGKHITLADIFAQSRDRMVTNTTGLYPAGRLDHDSEGLLLLTNHGPWQARISHPRHKLKKTYLAQVEGDISDDAIARLVSGVILKDGPARALSARRVTDLSDIAERNPPVRFRALIPTSWLELTINEGRNRQVRRMTAAVGFPTLRLIRTAVGPWQLSPLAPGESMEIARKAVVDVLG